jgi:F-type H+-transporting ATPase subunit epsilon
VAKKTFRLQIINPERVIVDVEVESVMLPATGGSLGVLRNHVPVIGGLEIGVVKYRKDSKLHLVACNLGVFEMQQNLLRILADTAESGEDIDVLRAQEAMKRAKKRLENRGKELDWLRAELALTRAIARVKAARRAGNESSV